MVRFEKFVACRWELKIKTKSQLILWALERAWHPANKLGMRRKPNIHPTL